MNGPLTALAAAHRRSICGPDLPERLDREDLEAAAVLVRLLDELGYRVEVKPPTCDACGYDLDEDEDGYCPTCHLDADRYRLTFADAQQAHRLARAEGISMDAAVELIVWPPTAEEER